MQISDMLAQYNRSSATGATATAPQQGVQQLVSAVREMTVGNVFEGTVNDIKNGTVTLGLANGQTVQARIAAGVQLAVGQAMFFQVKSNDGTTVEIRPYTNGNLNNPTLLKALDAAGKPYIKLVASNGLDERKIANMELYEHAHFDSYGVGENLITSASDPVFGGVYKLVAVKLPDGTYQPKMKCSDSASKAIIPGKKMPWRLYDENGQAQCDLIAMDGEVIEAGKPVKMVNLDPDAIERTITITPTRVKRLLVPHILNGELSIELPGIAEKKAYIAKQLTEETWETELRIEMPHKHYVNMTPAVAECRAKMYSELHGGKV